MKAKLAAAVLLLAAGTVSAALNAYRTGISLPQAVKLGDGSVLPAGKYDVQIDYKGYGNAAELLFLQGGVLKGKAPAEARGFPSQAPAAVLAPHDKKIQKGTEAQAGHLREGRRHQGREPRRQDRDLSRREAQEGRQPGRRQDGEAFRQVVTGGSPRRVRLEARRLRRGRAGQGGPLGPKLAEAVVRLVQQRGRDHRGRARGGKGKVGAGYFGCCLFIISSICLRCSGVMLSIALRISSFAPGGAMTLAAPIIPSCFV